MRANRLIPIAVLAFAVACSENATSPTSLTSAGGPLSNIVVAFTDADALTANTPSGGHLQTGTIQCTLDTDTQEFSCSSYEVAGVGHTNALLSLEAEYTAIIDCNNPGNNRNNPIESHTSDFSTTTEVPLTSSKNGRLRVPSVSAEPFDAPQVCPNSQWIPEIREGTLELLSFTYTLTFEDFTEPAVEITGP